MTEKQRVAKMRREIKSLGYPPTVTIKFETSDLLFLHAVSVFLDQRDKVTKMIRRNISPTAQKILKAEQRRKGRK